MKKFLIVIFAFLGFVFSINPIYSEEFNIPENYKENYESLNVTVIPTTNEKFYIENYVVRMNVNKNKSVDIVEDIDTYFTRPAHGIYRDIPFKQANITNINVSEQKSISYGFENINIKIGDPDRMITGPHHYRISYKYNYHDNKNEFYHNIIGTQWGTYIKKASFEITMPDNIDPNKVGLSIGAYGVKGFNGGAVYSVNGNKITGHTQKILDAYEGITIRIEVPDWYFNKYVNYDKYFVIIGIILLTVISFFTWYIYGKDEPVIPIVNFYPPKGLNAAEVELAYKGKSSTKGLVALLIELAQKGYLKINSNGKNWTIHKSRNYDGKNKTEKKFIKAIFEPGGNMVTKEELESSPTFYQNCSDIVEDLNKKQNQIFYDFSIGFPLRALMFICLLGLIFLLIYTISNYNLFSMGEDIILALFPTIAIILLVSSFMSSKNNTFRIVFFIIWSFLFGGIPLITLIYKFGNNTENLPIIFLGLLGLVISGICTYQLPKRNHNGQILLNNLAGLKNFINVAEKHRLQQLVDEDPEYFYNVLPAAYILDVSDKWIKQFETMMYINPTWYNGDRFNIHTFNNFTNNFNSVSVPSTANGGISSSSGGGGFSGGGGGGGGGGSW